jgi:hypothetical protein
MAFHHGSAIRPRRRRAVPFRRSQAVPFSSKPKDDFKLKTASGRAKSLLIAVGPSDRPASVVRRNRKILQRSACCGGIGMTTRIGGLAIR